MASGQQNDGGIRLAVRSDDRLNQIPLDILTKPTTQASGYTYSTGDVRIPLNDHTIPAGSAWYIESVSIPKYFPHFSSTDQIDIRSDDGSTVDGTQTIDATGARYFNATDLGVALGALSWTGMQVTWDDDRNALDFERTAATKTDAFAITASSKRAAAVLGLDTAQTVTFDNGSGNGNAYHILTRPRLDYPNYIMIQLNGIGAEREFMNTTDNTVSASCSVPLDVVPGDVKIHYFEKPLNLQRTTVATNILHVQILEPHGGVSTLQGNWEMVIVYYPPPKDAGFRV